MRQRGWVMNKLEEKVDQIARKIDALEVPIGYSVAGTSLSTPFWIDTLTPYMEFGVLACGLIIGVTTVILQIRKIRKGK